MTGESNAVIKNTKTNLLMGGTLIVSSKDAIAEVTNTGFRSGKGRLLRTLVYKYGFEKTFMSQVIKFLCVILFVTFSATIHLMIKFYSDWKFLTLLQKVADLITTAIPPYLVAAI